ncbi:MAG: YggT family protein [Burkholderiaceae bacterium]
MTRAVWFLLDTVGSLLAMACLLRAYMYWLKMGARDPIGHFVTAITDWMIKPLRRLMPSSRTIDWPSLAAAVLIAVALAAAIVALSAGAGAMVPGFGSVFLAAVYWLFKSAVFLLLMLVFAAVVLSWVNPHAPMAPTISALTNPFLMPLRRVIPLIGGIDLSPMVLIIGLMFLQELLRSVIRPIF